MSDTEEGEISDTIETSNTIKTPPNSSNRNQHRSNPHKLKHAPNDSIQQPSLPVAASLPDDGIPQTGEEYLLMVRHEAQAMPNIKSVRVEERRWYDVEKTVCPAWSHALDVSRQGRLSHHTTTISEEERTNVTSGQKTDDDVDGSKWQALFEEWRKKMKPLDGSNTPAPAIRNEEAWQCLLLDKEHFHSALESIAILSPGDAVKLLECLGDQWLEQVTQPSVETCRCILFLLMRIDKELMTCDDVSAVRRMWQSLRQHYRAAVLQTENEHEEPVVIHCAMLLNIIRHVFGQRDLSI